LDSSGLSVESVKELHAAGAFRFANRLKSERLVAGYVQLRSAAGRVGGCLRGEALLTAATWRSAFRSPPAGMIMAGVRWRVLT
jgi:hypothetical protein